MHISPTRHALGPADQLTACSGSCWRHTCFEKGKKRRKEKRRSQSSSPNFDHFEALRLAPTYLQTLALGITTIRSVISVHAVYGWHGRASSAAGASRAAMDLDRGSTSARSIGRRSCRCPCRSDFCKNCHPLSASWLTHFLTQIFSLS